MQYMRKYFWIIAILLLSVAADANGQIEVYSIKNRNEIANLVPFVFKMPHYTEWPAFQTELSDIQRLRRIGYYNQCKLKIDSLLQVAPDNVDAKVQFIYLALRANEYHTEEAGRVYEEVQYRLSEKDNYYARTTIEYYYSLQTRNFDYLIKLYNEAVKLWPSDPVLLYNRALVNIRRGRMDLSDKDIRKALTIAPDDVQTLYLSGFCSFWMNTAKQGVVALNKVESLLPEQIMEDGIYPSGLYRWRGALLYKRGDNKASDRDKERAVNYIPHNRMQPNLWWYYE
jgi:tetratricopeptide (TPR) repeat protein